MFDNPSAFPSQTKSLESNGQLESGRKRLYLESRLGFQEKDPLSFVPSDSPESYSLHIRKWRSQQKQEEQEEQEEHEWVEKHNANRTHRDQANESSPCQSSTKSPCPGSEPIAFRFRPERSTHARSIIKFQDILNPIEGDTWQIDRQLSQESGHRNNMSMELLQFPQSPSYKQCSSPLPRPAFISQSIREKAYLHSAGLPYSSPHPHRRIITPVLPALRHADINDNINSGSGSVGIIHTRNNDTKKATAFQLPCVQEVSAGVHSIAEHGRRLSKLIPTSKGYSSAPIYSSKLAVSVLSRDLLPVQRAHHSTPIFRQINRNQTSNHISQVSGPDTSRSTFSFVAPIPSVAPGVLLPQAQPASNSASQSSRMSDFKYGNDSYPVMTCLDPTDWLNQSGNHVQYRAGPLIIDLQSGSRSQAEKRKAQNEASRRYRDRRRKEVALKQRIDQLVERLQFLTKERDFYCSERDFFRDSLSQHIGIAQMPSRPLFPFTSS